MSGAAATPSLPRRRLRRLARFLLAALGLAAFTWWILPWCLPWPEALDRPPLPAAALTDRDGAPLRRLAEPSGRSAGLLPLDRIPQALVEATLAAEDRRFHRHGGIDFAAVARALRDGLAARRFVSGASTITQQLAKTVAPQPRTLAGKCLEALTARRIEMTWSKQRILEEYLGRISYGSMATGCGEAAWVFFAKPLADLSPAECACLAGLPQAPTRLNPWRHPDRALARMHWILDRMEALGSLAPEAAARARAEPLRFERRSSAFSAPHFVDLLLGRLPDNIPPGTTVRTTIDSALQAECERVVAARVARLADQHVRHAAVVVIDNASGDLLAMVGSAGYDLPGDGRVNGSTAPRSPGSALKPFTFLLALQQDASPADIIADLPVEFVTPTGLYRPENYNRRPAGPVSLRAALANSLNLSAVKLLRRHGGPAALVDALSRAGISTLTKPPDDYGLGLTIGGGEVNLLELTAAYAALARMGELCSPRFHADDPPQGNVRIFDPDAAWLLADILADNDARSASFGMTSALRLPFPCAVKTGTSTDYRDNWTLGFTPRFTVGVWVGNFDGSAMRGVSGVSGAAPVFHDIMTWLDRRQGSSWYSRPDNITELEIDPLTGRPVPPDLAGRRPVRRDRFRRDLAPGPLEGAACYDASGRVLLSRDYAAWLAGPHNWAGDAVVLGDTPGEDGAVLRILTPLPGTRVLLDPDLPDAGRRLTLRTNRPPAEVTWESDSLTVSASPRGASVLLVPGRHSLTAVHGPSGARETTWIEVRRL